MTTPATWEECDWLSEYTASNGQYADLLASNRFHEIINQIPAKYLEAARSLLKRHWMPVTAARTLDYFNVTHHAEEFSALVIIPPSNPQKSYYFLFDGSQKVNQCKESKDVVSLASLLNEGWKVAGLEAALTRGLRSEASLIDQFVINAVPELVHRTISREDCDWLPHTHLFKNAKASNKLPEGFASTVDRIVGDYHKRAAMLVLSYPYVNGIARSYWIPKFNRDRDPWYVKGLVLRPCSLPAKYMLFPYNPEGDNSFDPYGLSSFPSDAQHHDFVLCLSLLLHEGWRVATDERVNPGDFTDGRICRCT